MMTIIRYWGPVLLWMVLIFIMSTDSFSSGNTSSFIGPIIQFLLSETSPDTLETIHAGIRKCGHVAEYFILGVLLFRAFGGNTNDKKVWHRAGLSLIAVVLYAASDEFHQSFTSSRSGSVIDVGIDSIGGLLAQIACVAWLFYRTKTAGKVR